MRQPYTALRGLFVLLFGICFSLLVREEGFAQRIININPGFGTLDNAIRGDTTAAGARVDSNTIYRLQRGGLYILNGTFQHRYRVILEAAPGAGAKPRVIQGVGSGGAVGTEAWSARGTLMMKNVYMSAQDELGGGHERVIRIQENNIRVVLDSCVLDLATQAGFRFDATGAKVYFRNSVISNIGTGDSPNNGRGMDDRGNPIDTLILENSTFYNLTSRVIRDAGGTTNYCKVNHCTMYNIGQWGVSFGPCVTAIFTNNILVNGGYYGANPRGIDLTGGEPQVLITLKPLPAGGGTQTAQARNNNFYLDSLVIKAYPDSIHGMPLFDSLWTSFITTQGTGNTIYKDLIAFQHAPNAPANVVTDWYANPAPPNPSLDTAGVFNFAYPTGAPAYARGSDGKPLGDLNWLNVALNAVQEIGSAVPASFRLYEAYPNPFNPETNVRFDIRQAGSVMLEVYSLLGQKVAILVDEALPAGTHQVRWNGRNGNGAALSSGVYLFRLTSGSSVAVKKVTLLK